MQREELIKCLRRIEEALSHRKATGPVCVMPDYFVDRFVQFESFKRLSLMIEEKASEGGGGSIRGTTQREVKGGNAVNVAYALSKFDVRVNLITIANSLQANALKSMFSALKNSHLEIIEGRPGFTVALEFRDERERLVNVMISDPGDIKEFDGSKLEQRHWDLVGNSRLACVLNWSSNKMGNDLCKRVFTYCRKNRIATFFDPADLYELRAELQEFKRRILDERLVDYISLNDNEARILCKELCKYSLPQSYDDSDLKVAVRKICDISGSRVDLHTKLFSISCSPEELCVEPCHRVNQVIVTGAGDVWDSADVFGYISGLENQDRLLLANSAAGLYVSRENAEPPDPQEVIAFIKRESLGLNC